MLTEIQPLTQQQRLEARKNAHNVIQALEGEKPGFVAKNPRLVTLVQPPEHELQIEPS